MTILNILPLTVLLGFIAILKKLNFSWLSPPLFFSSLWSFFILAPLIFASKYPMNSFGLWIITFFAFAVGAGSFIANIFNNNQPS